MPTHRAAVVLEYAVTQHSIALVDEAAPLALLQVVELLLGELALGLACLEVHILDDVLDGVDGLLDQLVVAVAFWGLKGGCGIYYEDSDYNCLLFLTAALTIS